jgi:hypothetical protein
MRATFRSINNFIAFYYIHNFVPHISALCSLMLFSNSILPDKLVQLSFVSTFIANKRVNWILVVITRIYG